MYFYTLYFSTNKHIIIIYIYICLIEANVGKHGARLTVNCNLRKTKLSGCEPHSYLII